MVNQFFVQLFTGYSSTQPIADLLKGTLEGVKPQTNAERDARQTAKEAITRLERADWQPMYFAQQFEQSGMFAVSGAASFYYTGANRSDVWADVTRLIDGYLAVLPTKQPAPILAPDELAAQVFDVEGAAEFLGKKVETIHYHLYNSGALKGFKRGGSTLFSRAELEAMKRNPPRSGRPKGS